MEIYLDSLTKKVNSKFKAKKLTPKKKPKGYFNKSEIDQDIVQARNESREIKQKNQEMVNELNKKVESVKGKDINKEKLRTAISLIEVANKTRESYDIKQANKALDDCL